MSNEKLIESIVETYDLPSKMKSRVMRFAIREMEKLHLKEFDDIYNYVGRVVDGFRVPFNERIVRERIASGDKQQSDSKNPFYHLFGADDPNLIDLLEEPPEKLSVDEAINILGKMVSESDLQLLHQLAYQKDNYGDKMLNISPGKILVNVERIQKRLEELAHKYEQDGGLVLPRRTIWYIEFNPLIIKYKYRLTQRDKNEIIALHGPSGMNATETARIVGCDTHTVIKHWKTKGLRPGKTKLLEEEQKEIIDSYGPSQGYGLKAAKLTGYSLTATIKCWRKHGLEIKKGKPPFPQEKIDKIISLHGPCNMNATEAARRADCDPLTVRRHWEKVGLEVKRHPHKRKK